MIKVYSVVACMLFFTTLCVICVIKSPKLLTYFEESGSVLFVCIGFVIAGIIMQTCCRHTFRQSPMNYILLAYFTISWSVMTAGFCAYANWRIVLICSIMTSLMSFSLVMVAFCIKHEMTWCYGIGATFMLSVWPAIIFAIVDPKRSFYTMLAFIGTILASCYIIIDTEKVMETYGATNEYIYGALALYKDILVMFISLLSILGTSNR